MTWGSAKTVASDKQSMALTVTGQGQLTSAMVFLIFCSSYEIDSCLAFLSNLLFGAAAFGPMGSGVRRGGLIGDLVQLIHNISLGFTPSRHKRVREREREREGQGERDRGRQREGGKQRQREREEREG